MENMTSSKVSTHIRVGLLKVGEELDFLTVLTRFQNSNSFVVATV